MLDPKKIKSHFPIFKRKINGRPLTFLDSGASTQKPREVINAIKDCYENYYSNIHRGVYSLAEESTEKYEYCRKRIAKFINADENEIVFTGNCTESINTVAYSWGDANIKRGDHIIVSALEHHANLIPWQELAKRKKAKLLIIPLTKDYRLDMKRYRTLLSKKTALVAITAMSNVLGVIPPLKEIVTAAHKVKAKVLLDGAQYAAHKKTDVRALDCDFFTFSAHKMLGPGGIGILYAKKEILDKMPPFMFGGEMVDHVSYEKATYAPAPSRLEAGTPNIADIVAFPAALDFLEKIGMKNIEKHDEKLLKYAKSRFGKYKSVKLYTPRDTKDVGGVLSFTVKGVHTREIAEVFNFHGICVRVGQHCAEPLVRSLGVDKTARMSFYVYNTKEDIDIAEKALKDLFKIFQIKN